MKVGPHWLKGGPRGVPAGAGLMPEGSRLGLVLTILSNSGQERRRLFGQHPQAHEKLLVRQIVKRPDVEAGAGGGPTVPATMRRRQSPP